MHSTIVHLFTKIVQALQTDHDDVSRDALKRSRAITRDAELLLVDMYCAPSLSDPLRCSVHVASLFVWL